MTIYVFVGNLSTTRSEFLGKAGGSARCDKLTGTMDVVVDEYCAGDCLLKHELIHVSRMASCCVGYALCIAGSAGNPGMIANCDKLWNDWDAANTEIDECEAWGVELECAIDVLDRCCKCGKTVSSCHITADCCRDMIYEVSSFAVDEWAEHCDKAKGKVRQRCPFEDLVVITVW